MKSRVLLISVLFLILSSGSVFSQPQVIDRIVAIVGKNIIMQSDIESQYVQYVTQGNTADPEVKCQLLEQLLLHKLMVNQADLDSITVPESQVDGELDRRIRYFVTQIGSEKKLEEYYKKSIVEIKSEFRELIKEQLLAQTMQGKITKDISASPSDVKTYFNSIPVDSLPLISSELELAQIVRYPVISEEDKQSIKDQLEGIRKKIIDGTDFGAMAGLYSQDPGSAKKGGELGFVNRGDLVPEFEAIAFGLKGNEISKIFETKYGFHFMQLIERRGSQVNVRHILLKPSISGESMAAAEFFLDSVANLIKGGSMTFEEAARKFSDDTETKNNGGTMVNPQAGNSKFEPDQMDPSLFFVVNEMKPGHVTEAKIFETPEGKKGYRLLMLKTRSEPHRANLKDDYQKIQNAALTEKQNKAMSDWVEKKKASTYIRIDDEFKKCPSLKEWYN